MFSQENPGGGIVFDSEPFGQRAVRLGLATSEQVRLALQTQSIMAEKSGLIGEILVEMGWLDPQDYVSLVQELLDDDEAGKAHNDIQERFVKRTLECGYADENRIAEARKIQEGFTRKIRLIGQVMVDMGFITTEECRKIIETYPEP